MTGPWREVGVVETYSGEQFDLFDPEPDRVRLSDVAAGLAHTCRFGGQCVRFYSVAHHSLHVSREVAGADDPRLQLLGLLHDAGEAYVGDVPRPLKTRFDEFERLEEAILDAVWTALDVAPPTEAEWERVTRADDRLLAYEADALLTDGSWAEAPPNREYELRSVPVDAVRKRFRSRAETLLDRL
jgi:hypothetical protein